MSEVMDRMLSELSRKVEGKSVGDRFKLVVKDEGSILIAPDGVRISDEDADVTVTAKAEVFKGLGDGSVNPAAALMMGKIKVQGNMMLATKLGEILR